MNIPQGRILLKGSEQRLAVALADSGGDVKDAVLQRGDLDAVVAGNIERIILLHGLVELGMPGEPGCALDKHGVHFQLAGLELVALALGQVQTEDPGLLAGGLIGRYDGVKAGSFRRLDTSGFHFRCAMLHTSYLIPYKRPS